MHPTPKSAADASRAFAQMRQSMRGPLAHETALEVAAR
jgi:hypothetical protein